MRRFGLVFLCLALLSSCASAQTNSHAVSALHKREILSAYGKLPLGFEANTGQTDRQVKFFARGHGYWLFLTSREAVLLLKRATSHSSGFSEAHDSSQPAGLQDTSQSNPSEAVTMHLAGANRSPLVLGVQELEGKVNYFMGNDPAKWRANVSMYANVKYEGVYPGVDLLYHGNQGQLEYDFLLAPGVDPSVIRLKFEGREKLYVNAQGELVVDLGSDGIRMQKPVAYQTISGEKKAVEASYLLSSNNQVGFKLGEYDHAHALIIDPVLEYSTYLGGSGGGQGDFARGIAVDNSGNAYVTGTTDSLDFPTANTLQGALAGNQDVFVSKLSPDGSALVYSTYLGGAGEAGYIGYSGGAAIALDGLGNAYVTGSSNAPDFPMANALQASLTMSPCPPFSQYFQLCYAPQAIAFELNASGSALVYSTFLAGSGEFHGNGIAVDSAGNAYVTGSSPSSFLCPGKPIPWCATTRAFVTKISAGGTAFLYWFYLGGHGPDSASSIAVDSAGHAYVTGSTSSADFPTVKPLQGALAGSANAFVSQLTPDGSALVYSTYLGGLGTDGGNAIALDSSGNAFVTGSTSSINFPTVNALQRTLGGSANAFVSKLTPDGSALMYSTYLGGLGSDAGNAIAVDSSGNVYVTGSTSSTNFPTANALQGTLAGANDAFISEVRPDGSALVYSTYLGGSGSDGGSAIAVNSLGETYLSGYTNSPDFPTIHALQPGARGVQYQGFVAKLSAQQPYAVTVELGSSPNPSALGSSVTFTATLTPTSPGSGTPTGSVTFFDGPVSLSSLALPSSGEVVYATSALSVGSHSIIASYSGDANFSGSLSPAVMEQVIGPIMTLSATSLSFNNQVIGSTSVPQAVTLTNAGMTPLVLNGMTASASFAVSSTTCAGTLAVGQNCAISVTFTPTILGTATGTLTLTDNAPNSPQTIALTGTGEVQVAWSPASLSFAAQAVATSSAATSITVTNNLPTALRIASITFTGANPGDFAETDTCGSSVAANSNCTISVTFTPQATGTRTATLSVNDNANNSPQTITLTGTGLAPLVWSAASMSFGNQLINTTSSAKKVMLTNIGPASVALGSVTASGNFAVSSTTCVATLAGGAKCEVEVTFAPMAVGRLTGTLSLTGNVFANPQTVALSGTGEAQVAWSPSSLSFAGQAVATSSASKTVTLTNNLSAALSIVGITFTGANQGDFAETDTCGSSVAANSKCTISVTFTPQGTGKRTATLSISDSANNSPQTIVLTGTGLAQVAWSPASLSFAAQAVGSSNASKTVTLTNNLATALSISGITFTGANAGDFAETDTCGSSVAANSNCTISVTFTPQATGTRTATLSVNDNANNSPQTIALTGTGVVQVAWSPTSLSFGAQAVGTSSVSKNITLTNSLPTALSIASTFTGANPGDFAETDTCGSSVVANSTCTISVTFTPQATGKRTATLNINDAANNSPQIINLTGTATAQVAWSPSSLSFGAQAVGTSTAKTVTLTNNLPTALSIASITFTGANPGDFAESDTCGGSVAANSTCTISVTFTPQATSKRTATLNINDAANNNPQTVTLTGTGN